MRMKGKSWEQYEKELFKQGKISKEGIMLEKLKMDFAKLIYDCRVQRRLTQKALAQKMRVQQQQIAKIESGEENLTLETIGKLLLALGSSLRVNVVEKRALTDILEYTAA